MTYERLHGCKLIEQKVSNLSATEQKMAKVAGNQHSIVVPVEKLHSETQAYQNYVQLVE